MPYDPVRDRDLPSPATELRSTEIWRDQATPGSSLSDSGEIHGRLSHPPSFHRDARSPSVQSTGRNVSGPGGLRGLLNDDYTEESRRGSGERSSMSSHPEEDRARASLNRLMNPDLAPPVSKSNSASSLGHHSSSPSSLSPGSRQYHPNVNGFLTPATPAASGAMRRSRSPNYPAYATSPGVQALPLGYGEPSYPSHHSYPEAPGPSLPRRRPSVGVAQRPMPPPADTHGFDPYTRTTPIAAQLPLRSPSVSVSPRSIHQSLPPAHTISRPGSATSGSHPFFFQPPPPPHPTYVNISPATSSRQLSEDPIQPPSGQIPGERRSTVPSRRNSQVTPMPVYSPQFQSMRSPSPIIHRTPYNPHRISEPRSVLHPISSDEVSTLRQVGLENNPLRRKKRRPLPSWSGPSPGARSGTQPIESATSYFPSQENERPGSAYRRSQSYVDRRGSVSSSGRPSMTPGPRTMPPVFDEPPLVTPGGTKRGSENVKSENGNHLKRRSDYDAEGEGYDGARKKVGNTHYVGNASEVASHYNSRPEVGVQHREFSPIIGLKKFNNWIKSVLIGKFAWRGHGAGAKVLDIGCGKGGDLNKWRQARISLYVGMDIAATSVEQARGRFETMNRPGFDAYFFAHDCYSLPISDILPDQLKVRDLYDNVTMQFCMHYAFESPSKARMMIENVSRYLSTGGKFIGTIPDGEILLSRLNALPEDDTELKFGNSCYFIQFEERIHKGIYGHKYRFYLEDAVDDVPEYVVNWDNFVSLALEYRLRLVYRKSFNEVLQEEQSSRDFGPLLGRMKVINEAGESAMDEDQWEAANLYMAFAFEKF
ncbi:mRNA capping enzyme-domain-containing protein [Naematelia encephala]|uniref:mRNA cap guanine-N(7) methyltransferase n=1 Tax=Naematelia encephala TaxID=71784 RepID=A0A1Y2ALI8_9TREE|nr:mRNA capping enzyme-domain-containing protein [Naematelia encephala]